MKKVLIACLAVFLAVLVFIVLVLRGVIQLPQLATVEGETETEQIVTSVEDLKEGSFYIWHNEDSNDIEKDLKGSTKPDVFRECPSGVNNWEDTDFVTHTLWFSTESDGDIPTLYPGDELIYISPTKVPYDGLHWERFADYGYSIGVANLVGDESGHYYIPYDLDNGYAGYIDPESDATALNDYVTVSEIFIDRIGSVKVRKNLVTDGGTVFGLDRNKQYLCEWYTGTYYQDFYMTANTHVFSSIESFVTYDYEFLHSNCISITMPEWLKTGCYYLENVGFFRYVTGDDVKKYSGAAYDSDIDWNDPIILYDDQGFMVYDPTQKDAGEAPKSSESDMNEEENVIEYQGDGNGYDPDGVDDVGAEGWEDFGNVEEIVIENEPDYYNDEINEEYVEENINEVEEPYFDN